MTRVSSNIVHPRAWIHTQFAVANIASTVLVSSNPTNLVLAGAFGVKFIEYTANIIVPVIATVVVLFPFLLHIVFADGSLIPLSITMHELSEEAKAKKPVNPNIPNARGTAGEEEKPSANNEHGNILSLEEIMNPFLDKWGAAFGVVIMAATLITLLAMNAASQGGYEHPVTYVTVPAAFIMLCWDLGFGWYHRHETREIARRGREEVKRARAERLKRGGRYEESSYQPSSGTLPEMKSESSRETVYSPSLFVANADNPTTIETVSAADGAGHTPRTAGGNQYILEHSLSTMEPMDHCPSSPSVRSALQETQESAHAKAPIATSSRRGLEVPAICAMDGEQRPIATLVSLVSDAYRWSQETFPTVTAVLAHLPFALVPFAFAMFVLVQALVTKGWVQVFAYGWDHWVQKTGTVGSIGGMAFLSVLLCNVSLTIPSDARHDVTDLFNCLQFSGTNIGTTILLSRVIQTWVQIHRGNGTSITNRTFWATVYAMAIGVNYGAFSIAFSASLAGLLWRDILARKHIHVGRLEFARVNLPIIAVAMIVGCAVLAGEVYIVRDSLEYKPS
jgi:Na+/H+ antiporter NhaD/arsenite permease-like protein